MQKKVDIFFLYDKYKKGMAKFEKKENKMMQNEKKYKTRLEKLKKEKLEFQKQFAKIFIKDIDKKEK